jgi:hypothetical protein
VDVGGNGALRLFLDECIEDALFRAGDDVRADQFADLLGDLRSGIDGGAD